MNIRDQWKEVVWGAVLIGLLVSFIVANLSRTRLPPASFDRDHKFFTCAAFSDIDGDGLADVRGRKEAFGTNESISVVGYVIGEGVLTYAVSNTEGKTIVQNSRPNRGFGLTHVFQPGQLPADGYLVTWADEQGKTIGRSTFLVTTASPSGDME